MSAGLSCFGRWHVGRAVAAAIVIGKFRTFVGRSAGTTAREALDFVPRSASVTGVQEAMS
ncbi:MAG: hypothetical protein BVN33_06200 [Proteobacteria bacterium ST_bin13]|nr:MAG: hypothetical protein BVN33_06200 [Proteobacteria bacterium ST_bin13]